jgi:acetolactate synthase I/II/III large subunit
MLVSDYVIDFLAKKGIRDLFLVSGGGIMYLLDSVGRNRDVRYFCSYHEQAAVVEAEGYARIRNGVGACLVTTGPGEANAVSALPAAWVDSIPLIVISGQVKRELIADYAKIRQIGPQQANVIGMARPVTKYASVVLDPAMIRYELECAYAHATEGRPGPVFLEIPVDVQGAQIDPQTLQSYRAEPEGEAQVAISQKVAEVLATIRNAKRPILVCGNGIHRANAQGLLRSVLDHLRIPIALPLTAKDIIEEDHPLNIGIFGTAGQRRANFAIQNSDCLVALGAGLNSQKIGFNVAGFAPRAKKVVIDIDEAQLQYQVLRPDLGIVADAGPFLREMLKQLEHEPYSAPDRWLAACAQWKAKYPLIVAEYLADPDHVNSYVFYDCLAAAIDASDTIVTGNALDTTSYFQAYRVKRGQRTINSGWGAMGWCLPMAIGACIGNGLRRTLCVTGDGSFQFNSQELLTISRYRLPIKIFVFNNKGYSNIRGTQESFFDARYVGSDFDSGLANPDFAKLAGAFGLAYCSIRTNADLDRGIGEALAMDGCVICEVNISSKQRIFPKASAFRRPDGTFESRPLEDMAPFLPREEVWECMHMFDDDL